MGCFECGSGAGSQFQMCYTCIAKKKAARPYHFAPQTSGTDSVTSLTDTPLLLAVSACLSATIFLAYFFFGSHSQDGVHAAALEAGVALCWSLSLFTWMILWSRETVPRETRPKETRSSTSWCSIWSVAAIFIPAIIYRHAHIRWNDSRPVLVLHAVALVLAVGLTFQFPG